MDEGMLSETEESDKVTDRSSSLLLLWLLLVSLFDDGEDEEPSVSVFNVDEYKVSDDCV
jgi:hypothetical protein